MVGGGHDVRRAVTLEYHPGGLGEAIEVQRLSAVRGGVRGHRPGTGDRVEDQAEGGEGACAEEGGIEQRGGDQHRRAQIQSRSEARHRVTV